MDPEPSNSAVKLNKTNYWYESHAFKVVKVYSD